MITEIEVEGVGTMRQLNDWQIHRMKRIANKQHRAMALPAFGLGMTIQQFKKLTAEQRHAAWQAYCRLTGPDDMMPEKPQTPQPKPLPQPWERISEAEQVSMGRKLLAIKENMPHGHFGPWVRDKSGITPTQAARYMGKARQAQAA
jgi:hypothetical protein